MLWLYIIVNTPRNLYKFLWKVFYLLSESKFHAIFFLELVFLSFVFICLNVTTLKRETQNDQQTGCLWQGTVQSV